MQAALFCLLAVFAGAFAQIDDTQFKNATFNVVFSAPNKIKITPNAWRNDIGFISYHCNVNKPINAPTAGSINSPGITSAPWAWETSNALLTKGATFNFWVRMETNAPKPAPGYNSAMKSARL